MRTLLLLRHAKSSWKKPELSDHDRPLNRRGKRDAPRMGRLLAAERLEPDLIASSTARRARSTVALLTEAGDIGAHVVFSDDLYHAAPDTMLEILRGMPDEAETVLLVGHNPGMELLLTLLTGTHERLPTAALCHLNLTIAEWREIAAGPAARLINVWRPRDLL